MKTTVGSPVFSLFILIVVFTSISLKALSLHDGEFSAQICTPPSSLHKNLTIIAQSGCCSFAGGICGCQSGVVRCCNGQLSSCRCKSGELSTGEHASKIEFAGQESRCERC